VMEGYRDARKAVDRALALDDTLAEAFENLSFILAAFEFRWAEAAEAIERALALAPSNGQIVATAAINAAVGCRMDEALRLSQKAIELEPLSAPVHMIRARILGWTYHDDEAAAACEKALEIAPGFTVGQASLGIFRAYQGRAAEGVTEAKKEALAGYRNWGLTIAYHALGDAKASDEALAALRAEGEDWSFQLAAVHGYRGEVDQAFECLERAYFLRDSGIPMTGVSRQLRSLHADPRWPQFLARIGLPNPSSARGVPQ